MCGRVRLSSDVSEIRLVFRIPPDRPIPNFPPSWNAAPTDTLPVVRFDAKAGQRSLDMLRWGLIPYWAKDSKVGFANINAKAEGIDNKPAFRKAFERRRTQQHGGSIEIDSQVGEFTEFTVRLPRAHRARMAEAAS
jgi:putative SOS response-associated peptidase YedK